MSLRGTDHSGQYPVQYLNLESIQRVRQWSNSLVDFSYWSSGYLSCVIRGIIISVPSFYRPHRQSHGAVRHKYNLYQLPAQLDCHS